MDIQINLSVVEGNQPMCFRSRYKQSRYHYKPSGINMAFQFAKCFHLHHFIQCQNLQKVHFTDKEMRSREVQCLIQGAGS